MKNNFKTTENTISSYSERGSSAYEDPMNKNFLYGSITVEFIKQVHSGTLIKWYWILAQEPVLFLMKCIVF